MRSPSDAAGRRIVGVVALVLSTTLPSTVYSEGPEPFEPVDSWAWQAHFEAWVDDVLVQDQISQAIDQLPDFEESRIRTLLNEQVLKRIHGLEEPSRLPAAVVRGVRAHSLVGASLEAARLHSAGQLEEALLILQAPEQASDAQAAYLLARIQDELARPLGGLARLQTITQYRYALSLAPDAPQAFDSRLRIGQLFLELDLLPESIATLERLLGITADAADRVAVQVSLGEASTLQRDPQRAIATVMKLNLAELSPELRYWAIRRMADNLLRLGRHSQAISAYRKLLDETPDRTTSDPLLRLRLATALVQLRKVSDANVEIGGVLLASPPRQIAALAQLLRARGFREIGSFELAADAARAVFEIAPDSPEAALAAVEILISERAAGNGDLVLPKEARPLVDPWATTPERGLLAYRLAAIEVPTDSNARVRTRLGQLLESLPAGTVRELVHDDLAHRIQSELERSHRRDEDADAEVLADAERYLRPKLMDVNALLVTLETFVRAQRWSGCIRWGSSLASREERPIRRGLGSWRAIQCRREQDPMTATAGMMLRAADGEKSGPFSLALAALAAEWMVRQGRVPKALEIYEQAVEEVAEPRLLGPCILRLGLLELAAGDARLGRQRLIRGLSLTDRSELAADPFRKAAIVALARAASPQSRQVARILRDERRRAEPWWQPAYGYLAFRVGFGPKPVGGDVFSSAASQITQATAIGSRLKKVLAEARIERGSQQEGRP